MKISRVAIICTLLLAGGPVAQASLVQFQMSGAHLQFTRAASVLNPFKLCQTSAGDDCMGMIPWPVSLVILDDGVQAYRGQILNNAELTFDLSLPRDTNPTIDATVDLRAGSRSRILLSFTFTPNSDVLIGFAGDDANYTGTVSFINRTDKSQGADRVQGQGTAIGLVSRGNLPFFFPEIEQPIRWSFDVEETSCTTEVCFYAGNVELAFGSTTPPPPPTGSVPAPPTLALLLIGMIGVAAHGRRRTSEPAAAHSSQLN